MKAYRLIRALKNISIYCLILSASFTLVKCGDVTPSDLTTLELSDEYANQLGDIMSSVDEAGRGTATIAFNFDKNNSQNKSMLVFENNFTKLFFPESQAAVCGSSQYGTCSATGGSTYSVTKTFNGCSYGGYTLAGTVGLKWGNGATTCSLTGVNQTLQYNPSYSVSRSNSLLTVAKTGSIGSILTLLTTGSPKTYSFANLGTRRVLYDANQVLTLDITAQTTNSFSISGESRTNRTLNSSGNDLLISNGINGETCSFRANSLRWNSAQCNCPTTGNWSGSCSTTGAFIMTMTGCGTASLLYYDGATQKNKNVNLDRCAAD